MEGSQQEEGARGAEHGKWLRYLSPFPHTHTLSLTLCALTLFTVPHSLSLSYLLMGDVKCV